MKRISHILCCLMLIPLMTSCGIGEYNQQRAEIESVSSSLPTESISRPLSEESGNEPITERLSEASSENHTVTKMNVQIGDTFFTATLESNSAVNEFVQIMKEAPIVIYMSDYSGFEKVGSLGTRLTSSESQTEAKKGDIVLYNGDQIVMFYDTHSWSYTRIGKIDNLSGWTEALGDGDVQVTFRVTE